ncbi:hypothetical protein B9Z19DRAFT_1093219 [Tuber borchii]|uniref:Uncharacterized protein n=1 Tax=Tuber borchii TaxID=42251 RepID=A0A2T6ZFN5_TUBBO|nr:hypothetical protein B9Z19DRAFT_1093219 [Tuber borchii]
MLRYMYIILHSRCVSYVTVPAGVRELLERECIENTLSGQSSLTERKPERTK